MGLAEGTRLGPYRVGTLLGAGGMGEVYRARDERLARDVAVKVIVGGDLEAELLRRFDQEARAASALNHPGILTVYDVGVHEGLPYVVCELLEGRTLREQLRDGALPRRRAVELGVQVAQALAAAHEKGIVHRDLKPENVFVLRDGRAKILDFGLAKLVPRGVPGQDATGSIHPEEPGTRPGTVMGTVGYMSPEQVRGQPTDHRSDIFAFGAVLYEMLAGRRALQGASAVETMSAILKEDPLDVPAEARLGPGTERLLHRCLEKSPERRFQSASDLAFALEALSGLTHSTPVATVASPPARGRRAALAGLGALGAAALAGGGWALRGLRDARADPRFQRLTFRRGLVTAARFAADGQTIVYGASWDGGPAQVFVVRPGDPESAVVPLPAPSTLFAVSSRGELAIGLRAPDLRQTLARVSLAGGTPREVLEGVLVADWSPDGTELAVVRRVEGRSRLEYPIGKVLVETPTSIRTVRVSPDGRRVAYHAWSTGRTSTVLGVVDRDGASRELATLALGGLSLAWRGDDEIWMSTPTRDAPPEIRAVRLSGEQRRVLAGTGAFLPGDVSRDGRALVIDGSWRTEVMFRGPGDAAERDLAWFDWSVARALSADGKVLLFDESRLAGRGRAGGSGEGSVYVRRTDGSPAVRLADGIALDLSPDGGMALVHESFTAPELRLVPTGAGEVVALPLGTVASVSWARFMDRGRRVVIGGRAADQTPRVLVQDLVTRSAPVVLDAAGSTSAGVPTPDGAYVAFGTAAGAALVPVAGGPALPVEGTRPGDIPVAFDADGRRLVIGTAGLFPESLALVDRTTGGRSDWLQLAPHDRSGTTNAESLVFSADLGSYCYTVGRHLQSLHVVDGLV